VPRKSAAQNIDLTTTYSSCCYPAEGEEKRATAGSPPSPVVTRVRRGCLLARTPHAPLLGSRERLRAAGSPPVPARGRPRGRGGGGGRPLQLSNGPDSGGQETGGLAREADLGGQTRRATATRDGPGAGGRRRAGSRSDQGPSKRRRGGAPQASVPRGRRRPAEATQRGREERSGGGGARKSRAPDSRLCDNQWSVRLAFSREAWSAPSFHSHSHDGSYRIANSTSSGNQRPIS
jgi:hypothetical protein